MITVTCGAESIQLELEIHEHRHHRHHEHHEEHEEIIYGVEID
jgi:hypothetical protein